MAIPTKGTRSLFGRRVRPHVSVVLVGHKGSLVGAVPAAYGLVLNARGDAFISLDESAPGDNIVVLPAH